MEEQLQFLSPYEELAKNGEVDGGLKKKPAKYLVHQNLSNTDA